MRVLAQGRSDEQPIMLFEHYVRSDWRDADVDEDANVDSRRDAEREATGGPEALAAQARTTVDDLRRVLSAQPGDLVVYLPWGPWALSLDDFLTTRMLEIAIHTDDLAVSVGVETPALPVAVIDPVVGLLARLAVQRHARPSCARSVAPSAHPRRSRPSDVVGMDAEPCATDQIRVVTPGSGAATTAPSRCSPSGSTT